MNIFEAFGKLLMGSDNENYEWTPVSALILSVFLIIVFTIFNFFIPNISTELHHVVDIIWKLSIFSLFLAYFWLMIRKISKRYK